MLKLYQLFLTLALLALSFPVSAQCTDWDKLLGYKQVSINDAARDQYGNLYVVAGFNQYDLKLGPYTFPCPPGGIGAFIAKFDSDYSLLWAIAPEAEHYAYAMEIEVDAQQNIVVAGNYSTSISFDCNTLRGTGGDVFVVSYTNDGAPVWAISSSGAENALVSGLTISSNGNIILTSYFSEKSFQTPNLTEPDIAMGGIPIKTEAVDQLNAGVDSFIASIRATDGAVAWTQGIGGDGNQYEYITDVTTDSKNDIIVTGYFSSDRISIDGHVVFNSGIENYFLAKINSEGDTKWVSGTEEGIYQSGWGVEADDEDNILVVGRFNGSAKFGTLELAGIGESDVFVLKINPDGTPLNGTVIGGTGADNGTQIEVNSRGQVLVSGYYQSNYLEIGSFSSSKPDINSIHSFLATLSGDLTQVECVKFVTGDTESVITDFELDPFNNVMARVERYSSEGVMKFDSQILTDTEYIAVMAILGNTLPEEDGETESPMFPKFSLGKDTTLCIGQKLTLSVMQFCNVQYLWSTGSTSTGIEVTEAGVYWLDITRHGNTVRSKINVSYYEPITAGLGIDQIICPGSVVTWSLPLYPDAMYRWSDGGSSNTITVTPKIPGTYWVEVSNRCETVRETVMVDLIKRPNIELGGEIMACHGDNVTLRYTPAAGETLFWSDGSTNPTLSVSQTGTYQLTVNNGCVETTAEVVVTIKGGGEFEIPNFITPNGDGKNDHFILPHDVQNGSLLIFNRWGDNIFNAPSYEDNWPQHDLAPGVYFYSLRSDCLPEVKGTIHLMD